MEPKNVQPVTVVPVSKDDLELYQLAPISSQLPVAFANGKHLLEFDGNCAQCRQKIEGDHFRGRVSCAFPRVAVISAVGACQACRLFTRFDYRVHDDMSFSGQRDGVWRRWNMRPVKSGASGFRGLEHFLRVLWSALRWLVTPPSR